MKTAYQKLLEKRDYHKREFLKYDEAIRKVDKSISVKSTPNGNYPSYLKK